MIAVTFTALAGILISMGMQACDVSITVATTSTLVRLTVFTTAIVDLTF